jgi:hypothetical protein
MGTALCANANLRRLQQAFFLELTVLFVDMIRHVDDDNAVLSLQLAAKNIRRICVQRSSHAVFCHELRHNDGDGLAVLAAF